MLNLIEYNNSDYAFLDELIEMYPTIYTGCRTKKDFIKKYNINKNIEYEYMRKDGDFYDITDGKSYKYDKIMIKMDWFNSVFDTNILDKDSSIGMAPDVIELDDCEKFYDNEGYIVEIEVRGKREHDGCFFKMEDVSAGFGLENLHKVILNEGSSYEKNNHYFYFLINHEKVRVKKMFLTYTGILKVLFTSRVKISDSFVNWASSSLFTMQMGSDKSKKKLCSTILGCSSESVKDVLSKSSSKVSCIYLIFIGTVEKLRDCMEIEGYDDDLMVFKYGRTEDLIRRFNEHTKTYGKVSGFKPELYHYAIIDPVYASRAEKKLNNVFKLMKNKLNHEKYNELVLIEEDDLENIKMEYHKINRLYCHKLSNVSELIKENMHTISMLKEQNKQLKTTIKYTKKEMADELEKQRLFFELELLRTKLN